MRGFTDIWYCFSKVHLCKISYAHPHRHHRCTWACYVCCAMQKVNQTFYFPRRNFVCWEKLWVCGLLIQHIIDPFSCAVDHLPTFFRCSLRVNKIEVLSDNWVEERLLQSSGMSAVIRSGCSVISTLSGFSMTESSYSQPQFSTVQQLQDSSTLESQALSSSYHQPNLLHVSAAEVVSWWAVCLETHSHVPHNYWVKSWIIWSQHRGQNQ